MKKFAVLEILDKFVENIKKDASVKFESADIESVKKVIKCINEEIQYLDFAWNNKYSVNILDLEDFKSDYEFLISECVNSEIKNCFIRVNDIKVVVEAC